MTRGLALALVAVAALAVACSRDPAPRPPIDNRGGAVVVDAAGPDAGDGACVEACVRDRQMVATSIDAIRESCRRECAAGSP